MSATQIRSPPCPYEERARHKADKIRMTRPMPYDRLSQSSRSSIRRSRTHPSSARRLFTQSSGTPTKPPPGYVVNLEGIWVKNILPLERTIDIQDFQVDQPKLTTTIEVSGAGGVDQNYLMSAIDELENKMSHLNCKITEKENEILLAIAEKKIVKLNINHLSKLLTES